MSVNLFCSSHYLNNGKALYFCFEKVDIENLVFWNSYRFHASCMVSSIESFYRAVIENTLPPYPNEYSHNLGYEKKETYEKVVDFVRKKDFVEKGIFRGLLDGLNGMDQVLKCATFIVYASTNPVVKKHTIKFEEVNNKHDYNKLFGEIVMSFVFLTSDKASTVTHYGIFRNPVHLLDDVDEAYAGISMKLHGFGARMALTHFQNKTYMVTSPLSSMTAIFLKTLKGGGIHVGTNEDLAKIKECREAKELKVPPYYYRKDSEKEELLKKCPPLYHIDRKTGAHKIAVENTDLFNHLESLPLEKCQPGIPVDFSGYTIGTMKTLIDLKILAQCENSVRQE